MVGETHWPKSKNYGDSDDKCMFKCVCACVHMHVYTHALYKTLYSIPGDNR